MNIWEQGCCCPLDNAAALDNSPQLKTQIVGRCYLIEKGALAGYQFYRAVSIIVEKILSCNKQFTFLNGIIISLRPSPPEVRAENYFAEPASYVPYRFSPYGPESAASLNLEAYLSIKKRTLSGRRTAQASATESAAVEIVAQCISRFDRRRISTAVSSFNDVLYRASVYLVSR